MRNLKREGSFGKIRCAKGMKRETVKTIVNKLKTYFPKENFTYSARYLCKTDWLIYRK